MRLELNSKYSKKAIALLLSFCACALLTARAADTPIEPSGIYKEIDVRLAFDTVKALRETKGEKQMIVANAVIARPEAYSPPVLYILSSVLFEQGRKEDAIFWLYAAQLRGRIDANICADKSAAKIINAMNGRFSQPLSQYASTNLALLSKMVDRVVAWEEKTPCNYDRRWINLHGGDAMTGNTNDSPLSAPLDQWEAIRTRTRDEFASEFHRRMDGATGTAH